jgi:transitional endoplasmic reticulum ATPase
MDELDPATMRRFDVKLRFDYLHPEQAREMLVCQCRELGLAEPDEAELDRVERLRVLTPGDFAVVRRQASMCGLATPADLARVLVEECGLKEDGRKQSIGFV